MKPWFALLALCGPLYATRISDFRAFITPDNHLEAHEIYAVWLSP